MIYPFIWLYSISGYYS